MLVSWPMAILTTDTCQNWIRLRQVVSASRVKTNHVTSNATRHTVSMYGAQRCVSGRNEVYFSTGSTLHCGTLRKQRSPSNFHLSKVLAQIVT